MGMMKRAFISVKRQWSKSAGMFLVLTLLGIIVVGTLIVRTAIYQTEMNLWSNTPAVATIHHDIDLALEMAAEGDDSIWTMALSPREVEEVGNLPYVQHFDYVFIETHSFWSNTLHSYNDIWENNWLITSTGNTEILPFELRGVYDLEIIDIQTGVIELLSGTNLKEAEVSTGIYPILVSTELAQLNDLHIGSQFELESRVYEDIQLLNPDYLLAYEVFQVEVVGIYGLLKEPTTSIETLEIDGTVDLDQWNLDRRLNQIYVPIEMVERSPSFQHWIQNGPTDLDALGISSFFHLYDVRDMEAFVKAGNHLLSGAWSVTNLSGNFSHLTASMTALQDIVHLIFVGGISTTIFVLALTVVLCLYERRRELGIYLALGERQSKIFSQLILENILLFVPAFFVAILIGGFMSTNLSRHMIEQDIMRQIEAEENVFSVDGDLIWFNQGSLSVEEMMEAFDVSLDLASVAIGFVIGIFVTILITLISTWFIVKQNPSKVLR